MANSVEFKAKIKQGIIEIPEEYKQELTEANEVPSCDQYSSRTVTVRDQFVTKRHPYATKPPKNRGFLRVGGGT